MGTEGTNCFVCDGTAIGKYFTLATCRTQTSKMRIIEKLSQLLGEKYMVVIKEDDIICRGCTSMMNTLDRLEKEMTSLRTVVLRYLEKKYELEEGELIKSLPVNKITPKLVTTKKPAGVNDVMANRKRKITDTDNDEYNTLDKEKKDKSSMWMQCDKCKYTTNYNSFMVHHIRQTHNEDDEDDLKVAPTIQEKSQTESTLASSDKGEGSKLHESKEQTLPLESMEITKISEDELSRTLAASGVRKEESMSDESETVEMIAAEISEFTDERVLISNAAVESSQDSQSGAVREVTDDQEHVALQVASGDDSIDGANTLCMVDESGIIVQNMEQGEDGTLYVQVVETPDSAKQVLSVAEDGSVQMVEVMWDEMVSTEPVGEDNIPF